MVSQLTPPSGVQIGAKTDTVKEGPIVKYDAAKRTTPPSMDGNPKKKEEDGKMNKKRDHGVAFTPKLFSGIPEVQSSPPDPKRGKKRKQTSYAKDATPPKSCDRYDWILALKGPPRYDPNVRERTLALMERNPEVLRQHVMVDIQELVRRGRLRSKDANRFIFHQNGSRIPEIKKLSDCGNLSSLVKLCASSVNQPQTDLMRGIERGGSFLGK